MNSAQISRQVSGGGLDPLRYIKYSINESKIPASLTVPEDINDLVNSDIPKVYTFQKEKDFLTKYASIETSSRIKKGEEPIHKPPTSSTEGAEKAAKTSASAEPQLENPWYQEQVLKMMSLTGQNHTTCQFYLESQDWDMDAAVASFRSS